MRAGTPHAFPMRHFTCGLRLTCTALSADVWPPTHDPPVHHRDPLSIATPHALEWDLTLHRRPERIDSACTRLCSLGAMQPTPTACASARSLRVHLCDGRIDGPKLQYMGGR